MKDDNTSGIVVSKKIKAFKRVGNAVELIGPGNNCNFYYNLEI